MADETQFEKYLTQRDYQFFNACSISVYAIYYRNLFFICDTKSQLPMIRYRDYRRNLLSQLIWFWLRLRTSIKAYRLSQHRRQVSTELQNIFFPFFNLHRIYFDLSVYFFIWMQAIIWQIMFETSVFFLSVEIIVWLITIIVV